MKKLLFTILAAALLSFASMAQVAVSTDGSLPDNSAMLDVNSTTRGMLMPRMTGVQLASIINPANGLQVFCTTDSKMYIYVAPLGQWKEVAYSTGTVSPVFTCGASFSINHITGAVAPVSKTVTYGTVTNIPGETSKCWITSNLGADHQATASGDATEASAGWYWQFNRKQGYKHDGTTRAPNTTWINSINESSEWATANDPCTSELGSAWRIPTATEWTNADASGNWANLADPWNSGLKLHAAGNLDNITAALTFRGSDGVYWGNSQNSATEGWFLYFKSSYSYVYFGSKAYAFPIRCLRDNPTASAPPTVTTSSVTSINRVVATCGGNVTSEGSATVTARGICWNTATNPVATGSHTNDAGTTGSFTSNMTDLTAGTTYFVRAYATNILGTAYGNEISFTTLPACGTSITINHVAGNTAPVTKTVTYGIVTDIPGAPTKCWITSNLGADHQATAMNDATEASSGWYWQFNHKQGYKHDGITRTPNTTWLTNINENSDWTAANDPCSIELGSSWRIPTYAEWFNVDASGNWTNWAGPWNSQLKLHAAGGLDINGSPPTDRGSFGYYWSATQVYNNVGWFLFFYSSYSGTSELVKDNSTPLRCLK